jgi:hypothetical protein
LQQVPLLQLIPLPAQQSLLGSAVSQAPPKATHAAAAHCPARHSPLQQFVSAKQPVPLAAQLHLWEVGSQYPSPELAPIGQQSALWVQATPLARQVHLLAVHVPEQQSP